MKRSAKPAPSRALLAWWMLRKLASYWRREGSAQTLRRLLERFAWLPAPEFGEGRGASADDAYLRPLRPVSSGVPLRIRLLDQGPAPDIRPGDALVVTADAALDVARREIARALAQSVPVVTLVATDATAPHLRQLLAWADLRLDPGERSTLDTRIAAWLPQFQARLLPSVSVVVACGPDAAPDADVVERWLCQTYPGALEIVIARGNAQVQLPAAARVAETTVRRPAPEFRVIECGGATVAAELRSRGVAASVGDLVIFTGPDCLLAPDFVERHVQGHGFGDCDAAVGPVRVDVAGAAAVRDPLVPGSFLNCDTRNLSVRRGMIAAELEPGAAMPADAMPPPWDDAEIGYAVYLRGARIKPLGDGASVQVRATLPVRPPGSSPWPAEVPRALIARHPEFDAVTRRWRLAPRAIPRARRRLRVLTYRWHVAHQYELFKLGHEFTLVTDLGSQITRTWDLRQRPLPANARFASWRELDPRQFDLAILHFDENVLAPEKGLFGPEWGATFRWFMEHVRLPRIGVCHGTPRFRVRAGAAPHRAQSFEIIEPARAALAAFLGDTPVVCNSHQAQREWRFRRGRVIWHGFDPVEFPPAAPRGGILAPLGARDATRPQTMGESLYREVVAELPAEFRPVPLFVPDPLPVYAGNVYALWKFRNYVDEIRRHCAYFNPTLRSTMPRARGESMMCGVPTVSARNYDVDLFVHNGRNGFHAEEPDELREQLLFLMRNPEAARRIGLEGRRTALELFNLDRYLAEWRELIASVV